jgi:hypothetical protein
VRHGILGVVFVQSGALVVGFSPKGNERPYMAFFDSVIDRSFPAMSLIVTYLVMFGLKTLLLVLTSLMALSSLTFPALKR